MKDDQSPATKADIQRLFDATERWKDEILAATEGWKEELKGHFDSVIENLRHDFLGARHDKVEVLDDRTRDHETRISRLEARIGA